MENIKNRHTFGLDIFADVTKELKTADDFVSFLNTKGPRLLLGGGSDVLFTANFKGLIGFVCNKGIKITEDSSHYYINASAGENWHDLVTLLIQKNIGGLENLALIPGTCGAAPVQNIGAYGSEFKDFCYGVNVIDSKGITHRLKPDECDFGYRTSKFKTEWQDSFVITSIELKLNKEWQTNLSYGPLQKLQNVPFLKAKDVYDTIVNLRKEKLPDPSIIGNAGSFFQNPIVNHNLYNALVAKYPNMPSYELPNNVYKLAAGWLIDQVGLKGFSHNGAGIYKKQALILTNNDNATPKDVCYVAKLVVNKVQEKFGIKLIPEVRIIGESNEITLDML